MQYCEKVSLGDTVLVNYAYLADGTKVSALDGNGDGLLYLGSLIYKKTGDSIELESAGFAGGRFVAMKTADGGKVIVPMIHVTDHLGSVRAVVDGVLGEVVETNDYYPFGSRWDVATSLTDDTNRFRYNSKEEQFKFGTPYIDYGARQYDPVIARWFAQDPLAEKYYGISPYAFCAGNPVKLVDVDGRIPVPVIGALIGGGVAGVAAIIKGKSATEVLSATVGGAVDGAMSTLGLGVGGKFVASKFIMGAAGGGAGSLVEKVLNIAFGNQDNIDDSDIAVSTALGAGMNGASEAIEQSGKSLIKYLINSDATQKALEKEVKQSVKSAGRKTTPSSIKKAVDDKINEMIEAADKTLETFLQALGYSFGFYNEVLTDE